MSATEWVGGPPRAIRLAVTLLLPLVAVAVLLRFGRGHVSEPDRHDLALALLTGTAAALAAAFLFASRNLGPPFVDGSDGYQYCDAVGAVRSGELRDWAGGQRSGVAAMLPAFFARWRGVLDGLAIASLVSFGVLATGAYAWARAVHGRVAAVVAALSCAGVELVSTLPRNLTFYPEVDAVLVVAAAATTWAAVRRATAAFLLAGFATGLALALDVRSFVWAAPFLVVAVIGALGAPWRSMPLRAALFALGLAVTWPIGRAAYHVRGVTLEQQSAAWAQAAGAVRLPVPTLLANGGFLWGHSDLRRLPDTVRYLLTVRERTPGVRDVNPFGMERARDAYLPWAIGSGAIVVVGLLRRPRALVALAGTVAPFAWSLAQAADKLPQARFLLTGLLPLPMMFGLVVGTIAERAAPHPDGERLRERGRLLAVVLLMALLFTAPIPSVLSPPGVMRPSDGANLDRMIGRIRSGVPDTSEEGCAEAIAGDPYPAEVRIYGVELGAPGWEAR